MKLQTLLISLLFVCAFGACNQPQKNLQGSYTTITAQDDFIKYARNFKVITYNDIKLLKIPEPYKGAKNGLSYWLIPKGISTPDSLKNATVINTPVSSIVCTSTTHIKALELLGISEKLVGFASTQYISSEKIRQQVENGVTREVGRDSNLNIEVMLDLSPELLMSYSLTGDYSKLAPIERSGIRTIQNAAFLEETPLGRSEWIKFTALLFGKEKEADSIFQIIADNYNQVLKLVDTQVEQPTVLSGIVYGDTWIMPGGNSWVGKFFKDAGADFLWKDTFETGSLKLSFEAVYEKANKADYWIGAASHFSLDGLKGADQRYASFDAFSNKHVYTYNARQIPNGGNDYFESGISRPDIILNDLVKIVHPNLLPDYELYYYRKLE